MTICRNLPRGRTLHLVDIENLADCHPPDRRAVRVASRAYRYVACPRLDDHVVIGCDSGLAVEVGLAWPSARIVAGHGADGADRALLHSVDSAWAVTHYDRVVVGSGDHAFTDLVLDLRAGGVTVCVVSRPASLARSLRRAAGLVRPLVVPGTVTAAA